jgi:hypothetical protein
MQMALRFLSTIIGVIGAVVALIVSLSSTILHAIGVTDQSHGVVGFLLFLVALVGAFLAIPFPASAGVLMLLAGLGYIYVVGWGALIASPLLILAAIIAYRDRSKQQKSEQSK